MHFPYPDMRRRLSPAPHLGCHVWNVSSSADRHAAAVGKACNLRHGLFHIQTLLTNETNDKNETASIVVESPSIKLLDYCNVILYTTVCLTTSINKLRRVHGQSDRWFASIAPSCLPINEAERIAYTQSRSWHTKSAHRKRRQHIV